MGVPEHLVGGSSRTNILREATMPFVVKLISPSGKMYFVSAPDFEGMRYRTEKTENAEHFPTREAAEDSVIVFRKIDGLKDYSYSILEV
jgi:hypothetical protein